ncbi:sensor histidine kinase [Aquibium oceanicum]|uniref:sensor histidine kinase n=1 Tax=Aquibium oceanicum TaxID=1670800 RepID=UPI000A4AAC87|nr:PAS domain-containing sensor histidine kinase [Aquibium oceanicum]
MSRLPAAASEGFSGLAEACGRLVHPSVTDTSERGRQRRLLGVALAGPFLVSAAFAQVLAPVAGVPVALAAICMCFVIGWTVAVAVAQSGSRSVAGPALLVAAVAPLALLVPLAGGPSSPLFLSFVPLLLEPVFVARTRFALVGGALAAAAAIIMGVLLPLIHGMAVDAPAAWFWLVPLAYAGTLWLRRAAFLPEVEAASPRTTSFLADRYPAVTMRLSPNGEVSECSAQAHSVLTLDPQFLLGAGLLDRVHVADRIAYLAAVADMREGAAYRSVELRLRLPADADSQPGHGYRPFVLEFVSDEVGEDGFAVILRENTTVARLREELDAARGCAETEKIRFLATVSHELRTPLNTIIGFSDMLLCGMAGPFGNERQREYTGLVRESGEHLLAVVNAILDVAKLESGTYPIVREHFRMLEAVETSKAIMSYQAAAKGVELECRVDETVGEVHADKRALQQILINLLSNAVKFTPAGGTVTVKVERQAEGVRLSVSDTGIGIAEEDLPRIGKPFVQVLNDYTRQYEGTGLGLSLVRGLVELHGGSMAVESAPGMGTSVEITIPFEDCTGSKDRHDAEILTISPSGKPRRKANEAFRQSA